MTARAKPSPTPDELAAKDAYLAHLSKLHDDPSLKTDPEFIATRDRLHGDFMRVFG
jgi:hypothetical protein